MRKNILLVGDNPILHTGNGNMLSAVISQLDTDKYKPACFVSGADQTVDPFIDQAFNIVTSNEQDEKLLHILITSQIDYLIMVGLDIWRYAKIFKQIVEIRKQKKFCWIAIFPYDIHGIRKDWIAWMNCLDIPCVYSKYGYDMLKDYVPNLQYFRPPMWSGDVVYERYDAEKRAEVRHQYFREVSDSQFIIGCIAKNQIRKDIPKLIRAYLLAKKENPNLILYLHTDLEKGSYNLKQMAFDMGAKTGDVVAKSKAVYSEKQMVDVYNSIDCLVNCSAQEGLSWTVLQAMCCGTPVIASRTTSQTELVEGAGTLVALKETLYIPVITQSGESHIEAYACKAEDIKQAILDVSGNPELQDKMKEAGLNRSKEWLEGVSDVNELIESFEQVVVKSKPKIEKVLFAQHSAAGDVLMTTQCFKGIKERHPNMKLVYMTQPQYKDIIRGNPYIDEIIDWDESLLNGYKIKYNPHGEHILIGQFNNGDTPLHAMYPYFCKVEADKMFIKESDPGLELPEEYIVVHTTGGDAKYRTYKHIDMAVNNLSIPVIQIGGMNDLVCHKAIDFRGKLNWNETAWVMKRAKVAIAVDSFPMHLAGVLGTPVIGLFGPAPARVTGAYGDRVINIEPDRMAVCKTMAACYGQRNCTSPCINSINPTVIRKALLTILEEKS